MSAFNGNDAYKVISAGLSAYFEDDKYKNIKMQAESDPHFPWGDGLHVLLISDRALGRAKGLHLYLTRKTNVKSVHLSQNTEQIREYLEHVTPDIIIFIGMAGDKANYKTISMVKEANKSVLVVMFASLDIDIECECRQNGIRYAFSSNRPIMDGLLYLRQSYKVNAKIVQMEAEMSAQS